MSTYSIAQAKDQLSKLVDEALNGQQVTITRHGKPVVTTSGSAGRPTHYRGGHRMASPMP